MDRRSSFVPSGYRGRLAPSPTGYLHIGHARTFCTAWKRARAAGGALVMRMEDLDRERSRAEHAEAALEDLNWLGLHWDEGPDVGGPFGPYTQSERTDIYLAAWRRLHEGGFIYPCLCSRKDMAASLGAPHESAGRGQDAEDEPVYPGTCRTLDASACGASGEAGPRGLNWRLRVPDGEAVEFEDGNMGRQRFVAGIDFGDFLIWRRDGVPSYQLACVADDAAMRITEVVRGADLLKSTARQILLNRALDLQDPQWFHCALSVDGQGRRLAKRHDALSIRELRRRGRKSDEVLGSAV
ncbi:tRNA glutamyl-Q(34) synthetase GluQRS [Telmatobacter sp. DSM 110680]|uniref:tRNA glutamyl-Q(34) synthetase GluQRS n=1 Tax=Telmatobacter sp. DSM 110680 TaxID=3036704 RepID=A0AAU7DLQ9_9BACT